MCGIGCFDGDLRWKQKDDEEPSQQSMGNQSFWGGCTGKSALVAMYVGVRNTATKTSERSKQPIDCLYAVNGKASQGYLFASYYTCPYIDKDPWSLFSGTGTTFNE